MRKLWLTLLLLLLASPAAAVTKYIAPGGNTAWGSATSPGSPASIATANSSAVAGETIIMAAGTYNAPIEPINSGTSANPIIFVGNIANPATTVITYVLLDTRDYVSIKGVRSTGSWTIDARTLGTNHCHRDSITYSICSGSFSGFGIDSCVITNNTMGTLNSISTKWAIYSSPFSDTTYAAASKWNKIEDNRWYFGSGGASSNAMTFAHLRYSTVKRNRATLYTGPNTSDTHARNQYNCQSVLFEDNYWEHFNATAGHDAYICTFRDVSKFNVARRDTYITMPGSLGTSKFVPAVSGTYQNKNAYNRWENCYIKVNGYTYYQNYSNGDVYDGNVFDMSLSSEKWECYGDSLQFTHNTFYKPNGPMVVRLGIYGTLNSSTWTSNIFYAGSGGLHVWVQDNGTTNWNHNLYYSPSLDSTNATQHGRVGPGTTVCTSEGIDCNSRWGNPAFVSPSTGDFSLGASSLALGLGPDGYVGARGAAGPDTCPDAARPGKVTDLLVTGGGAFPSAAFTAPGPTQFTGDGYDVEVYLKYDSVPITTDAQFHAATQWSDGAYVLPGDYDGPGQPINVADDNVGPGTYWVAAKARRISTGVWGCLSNTDSVTVPPTADVTPPASITTLATSSPTPSTITLNWTAVGDDGLTGTATSYQIRRNFGAPILNESTWNVSTVVTSPPTPQVAGSAETKVVTGLSSSSNYYFAVRAVDEANNVGALSNSPLGTTTPDVTRPGPTTTLSATPLGPNVIRLNWTAVGDDSLTGQAAFHEIRRALSPIIDLTTWNAATVVVTGMAANAPGTVEVYSAASLTSSTTYYFNVRTIDEAGNQSTFSNSPSATTTSDDVEHPGAITNLVVSSTRFGMARVTWTASGDDASVGTATRYDFRIRGGADLNSSTWEDTVHTGTGLQGRTYVLRYPSCEVPAPLVSGTPQQFDIQLQPGVAFWIGVVAYDEDNNESVLSNIDSTLVINAGARETPAGQQFIYGGAAPTQPSAGAQISKAWPYLHYDTLTTNVAELTKLAQHSFITINPNAMAADSFAAARRIMRMVNPKLKVLVEPVPDATYSQGDSAALGDSPRYRRAYDYYLRMWQLLENTTAWPPGFVRPYLTNYGLPAGYVGATDTTSASAWLWAAGPSRKNAMFGTITGANSANAGVTLRNVNLALRDPSGRLIVAERTAQLYKQLFYDRYYTDADGVVRHLVDGIFSDLHSHFIDINNSTASLGDSVDTKRAGYGGRAEFNTWWTIGSQHLDRKMIELMPDWTYFGANGGSGSAYASSSGRMRENYPLQQGGTFHSNAELALGGAFVDSKKHTTSRPFNTVFMTPSIGGVGDSAMATSFNPDTAVARKEFRFGYGSALLWDAYFNYGPLKASAAHGQSHPRGAYYSWPYDEQSVRGGSGQAFASAVEDSLAWLGSPTTEAYQHYPGAAGAVWSEDFATSTNPDSSQWSSLTKGVAGRVTIRPGGPPGALFHMEVRPAGIYGIDYQLSALAVPSAFTSVGNSDYTISGYIRADTTRFVSVGLRTGGGNEWSNSIGTGREIMATPTWRPFAFRVIGGATSEAVHVRIYGADTLGTVQFALMQCHRGDSTLYIREFQNGVVLVNPSVAAQAMGHTFGRMTRRITARPGVWQNVNNGSLSRAASVPASDGLFLSWATDSIRPATPTIAGIDVGGCDRLSIRWVVPGDDSLTGTADRYELRRSLSAITSDALFAAAALVSEGPCGSPGSTVATAATDLATNTTYHFAVRVYDEVNFPSAISTSSSATTSAVCGAALLSGQSQMRPGRARVRRR